MAQAKPIDYQALHAELDDIVVALQRDDSDVDLALKHYARGLEIIKLMGGYLKTADIKVRELKASFSK